MAKFDYSATYYKFIGGPEGFSNNFPYKMGLNRLSDNNGEEFQNSSHCSGGGLYFTNISNIFAFLNYGNTLCTIVIPDEAHIVDQKYKYKCDQFIIKCMEPVDSSLIQRLVISGAGKISDALIWAAEMGYIDVLKDLIEVGINVLEYRDKLFVCGARRRNISVITFLINLDPDIDMTLLNRCLIEASCKGHLEVVDFLIRILGADCNAKNDLAIQNASKNGHLNVVLFLFNCGAKISGSCNYTLHLAALYGHLDIVKALTDREVYSASDRLRAAKWAERKGRVDIVDLLRSPNSTV